MEWGRGRRRAGTVSGIVMGNVCDNCGSSNLTTNFAGLIIILDPENSEIAKELGIKKPGAYAVKVG